MAREREREAGLTETERPNRTAEMVSVIVQNIIMRGDSSVGRAMDLGPWVEPTSDWERPGAMLC